MPISYELDVEQKIVMTTMEGVVEDDELLAFAHAIGSDERLEASFVGLVYAKPEKNNLTAKGVRQAADVLVRSRPVEKLAIVASSDSMFGLSRMYEILGGESNIPIQVFRDEDAAKGWLEI